MEGTERGDIKRRGRRGRSDGREGYERGSGGMRGGKEGMGGLRGHGQAKEGREEGTEHTDMHCTWYSSSMGTICDAQVRIDTHVMMMKLLCKCDMFHWTNRHHEANCAQAVVYTEATTSGLVIRIRATNDQELLHYLHVISR